MQAGTCLRFGAVSSILVALRMLIANSFSDFPKSTLRELAPPYIAASSGVEVPNCRDVAFKRYVSPGTILAERLWGEEKKMGSTAGAVVGKPGHVYQSSNHLGRNFGPATLSPSSFDDDKTLSSTLQHLTRLHIDLHMQLKMRASSLQLHFIKQWYDFKIYAVLYVRVVD